MSTSCPRDLAIKVQITVCMCCLLVGRYCVVRIMRLLSRCLTNLMKKAGVFRTKSLSQLIQTVYLEGYYQKVCLQILRCKCRMYCIVYSTAFGIRLKFGHSGVAFVSLFLSIYYLVQLG